MSEPGIEETDLAVGFIDDEAEVNFRYQYATATGEQWDAQYGRYMSGGSSPDTDKVAANVAAGNEVVRRIRQAFFSIRWPARTQTAANTMLIALRDNSNYGNARARRGAPGWYDVLADLVLVDPGGWTPWIRIEDLDQWETE